MVIDLVCDDASCACPGVRSGCRYFATLMRARMVGLLTTSTERLRGLRDRVEPVHELIKELPWEVKATVMEAMREATGSTLKELLRELTPPPGMTFTEGWLYLKRERARRRELAGDEDDEDDDEEGHGGGLLNLGAPSGWQGAGGGGLPNAETPMEQLLALLLDDEPNVAVPAEGGGRAQQQARGVWGSGDGTKAALADTAACLEAMLEAMVGGSAGPPAARSTVYEVLGCSAGPRACWSTAVDTVLDAFITLSSKLACDERASSIQGLVDVLVRLLEAGGDGSPCAAAKKLLEEPEVAGHVRLDRVSASPEPWPPCQLERRADETRGAVRSSLRSVHQALLQLDRFSKWNEKSYERVLRVEELQERVQGAVRRIDAEASQQQSNLEALRVRFWQEGVPDFVDRFVKTAEDPFHSLRDPALDTPEMKVRYRRFVSCCVLGYVRCRGKGCSSRVWLVSGAHGCHLSYARGLPRWCGSYWILYAPSATASPRRPRSRRSSA